MAKIKRQHIKAEEITWHKAYDLFQQEKERYNIAESTLINYRLAFNRWNALFDIGEDALVSEGAEPTYDDFVDVLKEVGLKPETINTYIRAMSVFFIWLYKANLVKERRPVIALKLDDPLPRFLSDEDIEKLIGTPYDNKSTFRDARSYTLAALMLATGIRVGSAAEIRIEDWDRENGILTLRKTKTRKAQMIYLPAAASEILDRYYYDFLHNTDIKYLFPNYVGQKISVKGLEQAHILFCEARGVENNHLHSLRHTFARNYIQNGGNLYRLQKMLNHNTIRTTARYGRLFDEDVAIDMEHMNILNDYVVGMKKVVKRKH